MEGSAGSEQKYSHESRVSTSVTLNTDHSEKELSDDTNESQHWELDETEKKPISLKTKENQLTGSDIFSMIRVTRNASHSRRETVKKIIIGTYREEYAIVAETEDLIIEYCVRERAIINLFTKKGEPENQYCKMRKQHIRDWPDNTSRIREEGLLEAIIEY